LFESGKIRTELVWTGKRKRLERLPSLPFQTVEVVNEPREKTLDLYSQTKRDWYNLLIWGDNKLVMNSLLKDFEGKINLIYIDPPFATGADFRMPIRIEDEKFIKEPSGIEIKAYRDTWGEGLASYLQMMYDRLILMKRLLAESGSIYVHLDYRVVHYVKIIMDEIFGKDNLINEVIWAYRIQGISQRAWARKHDTILFYAKNKDKYFFEPQKERVYYEKPFFNPAKDENGRYYRDVFIRDVWDHDDTKPLISGSKEYTGFRTQKSEGLLRRIIISTSRRGDLVADFFCGSGTTLAVAEKLGRRWIGCDLSKYAIHITRKRLLDIPGCRPFKILNLGFYQKHKLMENGVKSYRDFILKLYEASPISGYAYVHGRKGRRLIHIGAPDSFVTEREIRRALQECRSANSTGLDVLGWEFEMGLYELIEDLGREYGVDLKLKQIPVDILDMRKRELANVKFFDLNYLDLDVKVEGRKVTVEIKRFVIANPEYLPEEIRESVKDFRSYIDYWAVDFDYKNDVFHNMRQEYRTRKNKNLRTRISYEYKEPGEYDILVKVVDIFGNDTNKLVHVRVE